MTAAPVPEHAHRVRQLLASTSGDLGEGLDLPLFAMDATEVGDALRDLAVVKAQLAALELRLVEHAETVDLGGHAGGIPLASWLRDEVQMPLREAKRLVKLAHQIAQPEHELTACALGAGQIPAASAALILDAVDGLPEELQAAARHQAEVTLVEHARTFDTGALRKIAERIDHTVDPEGADRREGEALARLEAKAARECFLSLRHNQAQGWSDLIIRTPILQGLKLGRQLEAMLNPRRPDPIDLIDDVNEKGVRIGVEERRGLAFAELIDRIPLKALPKTGGCEPTIVVTMTLATLMGGLESAGLDTGHLISPAQARRLAAEHGVIPAVLGTKSEVLDLGRRARIGSRKQRLAMCIQQHGTCAEEDCTTPVSWGEAAHLVAWCEGGNTNLIDLVIACRRHHRQADHPDYQVTRLGPGKIRITRRRRT